MREGGEVGMGLTERHWFEDEDVPENYEWALEDAVYNSRANRKTEYAVDGEKVIDDLNVAKLILRNRRAGDSE